jgi:hypothetical protein
MRDARTGAKGNFIGRIIQVYYPVLIGTITKPEKGNRTIPVIQETNTRRTKINACVCFYLQNSIRPAINVNGGVKEL